MYHQADLHLRIENSYQSRFDNVRGNWQHSEFDKLRYLTASLDTLLSSSIFKPDVAKFGRKTVGARNNGTCS